MLLSNLASQPACVRCHRASSLPTQNLDRSHHNAQNCSLSSSCGPTHATPVDMAHLQAAHRGQEARGGGCSRQQTAASHHQLRQPAVCRPSRPQLARSVRAEAVSSATRGHRRELVEPACSAVAFATETAAASARPAAASQQRGSLSRALPQPSAPRRPKIAVDVDEVLGRFVYALNVFCKEAYGMDYTVSDFWVYEFAKIWNCSQDQSNHIVHEFFKSDHFNDGIPIIPGAFETLCRLSQHCDLVVVTSRQHVIQDLTLEWLDRHYAGLFEEVYFGNHFALQGASRKKSDICKSIGADVLIDDNVGYAMDCADAGIQVLLYDWEDSYPWSKLPEGFSHPNIQVVRNWAEVEAAVAALAAADMQTAV